VCNTSLRKIFNKSVQKIKLFRYQNNQSEHYRDEGKQTIFFQFCLYRTLK
jgi:hypothetical protein